MVMKRAYRTRRMGAAVGVMILIVIGVITNPDVYQQQAPAPKAVSTGESAASDAQQALDTLPIKGRAPKTSYERTQFGDGWQRKNGCDMRNVILNRDLKNVVVSQDCKVQSGTLDDPYTGKTVTFVRGADTSDDVQIDHVVALSDAWQKGAQGLTPAEREALANDPLELLAVDGTANQNKSDGDAATWLPDNKAFRCQYVARQIAVKVKYKLWVTQAERDAMKGVLDQCPGQGLPLAN